MGNYPSPFPLPLSGRVETSHHGVQLGDAGQPDGMMSEEVCCYPPCKLPATRRHFCADHARRWDRGGRAESRGPRGLSFEQAFLRIGWTERLVVPDLGPCLEWNGARDQYRYGVFRQKRASRIMWGLTMGPIPEGMHMCHHCDNPPCINPEHLFPGTRSDNMRDMVAKGRHRFVTDHPLQKLTDEQVREIRAAYTGRWGQMAEMAREYGVSGNQISWIIKGKRRQDVA